MLEAAHQVEADVLVCGTRGRGAFARALLGSTSSSLLHHTDLPLLLVPDGGGRLDGPVIAAYDGSESAERAITTLGRLLGSRPAIVVHAWDSAFHHSLPARAPEGFGGDRREIIQLLERTLAENAEATTQQGVAAARAVGLEAVGETVGSGAGAWRAVAAVARQYEAAVIAVGARGLGAVERRHAGRTDALDRARRDELRLIEALLDAGDDDGVIGGRARRNLRQVPSMIYWQGLARWGIRRVSGTREQWGRSVTRSAGLAADDDGQLVAFVRRFEEVAADLAPTQPGCLFVSFIYEASSAAAARAT